jgi:predicted AAA+ superfamily ATPase
MAARYQRLLRVPRGSFFLYGVRGVGKSTWARAAFPDAHVVDLLDETRHQSLLANPGLFWLELEGAPRGRVVIVDEVQRVPALLNEVHRAIEGARRRFVLLGSSARKLKAANTNLLAGRATVQTMFPLTPAELGSDFGLERVLCYGSIPLVWQSEDPRATLEASHRERILSRSPHVTACCRSVGVRGPPAVMLPSLDAHMPSNRVELSGTYNVRRRSPRAAIMRCRQHRAPGSRYRSRKSLP